MYFPKVSDFVFNAYSCYLEYPLQRLMQLKENYKDMIS